MLSNCSNSVRVNENVSSERIITRTSVRAEGKDLLITTNFNLPIFKKCIQITHLHVRINCFSFLVLGTLFHCDDNFTCGCFSDFYCC